MTAGNSKYALTDVINVTCFNLVIQLFYGTLPASIYIKTAPNTHQALLKIHEMIPSWGDPKLYVYFVGPIFTSLVFLIYTKLKKIYLSKFVGSNLQPTIDFISQFTTLRHVTYFFALDLVNGIKKIYVVYIGIMLFFCGAFISLGYYKLALFFLALFVIYNGFLNYIELRFKYGNRKMK